MIPYFVQIINILHILQGVCKCMSKTVKSRDKNMFKQCWINVKLLFIFSTALIGIKKEKRKKQEFEGLRLKLRDEIIS